MFVILYVSSLDDDALFVFSIYATYYLPTYLPTYFYIDDMTLNNNNNENPPDI